MMQLRKGSEEEHNNGNSFEGAGMNSGTDKSLTDAFVDDMAEGYRDGGNPDNPEPSENRSASYRHGFANARDDTSGSPRATAQMLRLMAEKAIKDDVANAL
jgi:hypothetical protein